MFASPCRDARQWGGSRRSPNARGSGNRSTPNCRVSSRSCRGFIGPLCLHRVPVSSAAFHLVERSRPCCANMFERPCQLGIAKTPAHSSARRSRKVGISSRMHRSAGNPLPKPSTAPSIRERVPVLQPCESTPPDPPQLLLQKIIPATSCQPSTLRATVIAFTLAAGMLRIPASAILDRQSLLGPIRSIQSVQLFDFAS